MQLTFSCRRIVPSVLAWLTSFVFLVHGEETPFHQENILMEAEANREAIEKALDRVPANQRPGLEFLLTHMPLRDLRSLSADFLLENLSYAYRAWRESPWRKQVSEERFFNDVLPYASINERRDAWRPALYEKLKPLIRGIDSPGLAAARLNQEIFSLFGVKYSTRRKKADQSPFETMENGLASCTGLSILLIDACRAVGIPARFVGVPLWSDGSGNHSWVEVWDDGWHFTGAAEPAGDALDQAWFIGRAAKAERESQRHAIYAVSFRRTPQPFPMVWKRGSNEVHAVNVTDRYTSLGSSLPEGKVQLMFRVLSSETGDRCSAPIQLRDPAGSLVFEGASKDERFDANDHLSVPVEQGQVYELTIPVSGQEGGAVKKTIKVERDGQLVELQIDSAP
ncbi:MAG: transglutaminase-like domain-containing protein [Limisphaerales bacterium]|jgi:hypothetical protein